MAASIRRGEQRGVNPGALRTWVRRAEVVGGPRPGPRPGSRVGRTRTRSTPRLVFRGGVHGAKGPQGAAPAGHPSGALHHRAAVGRADITCVRTLAGCVYAVFVTDVFSSRVVGRQVFLDVHVFQVPRGPRVRGAVTPVCGRAARCPGQGRQAMARRYAPLARSACAPGPGARRIPHATGGRRPIPCTRAARPAR